MVSLQRHSPALVQQVHDILGVPLHPSRLHAACLLARRRWRCTLRAPAVWRQASGGGKGEAGSAHPGSCIAPSYPRGTPRTRSARAAAGQRAGGQPYQTSGGLAASPASHSPGPGPLEHLSGAQAALAAALPCRRRRLTPRSLLGPGGRAGQPQHAAQGRLGPGQGAAAGRGSVRAPSAVLALRYHSRVAARAGGAACGPREAGWNGCASASRGCEGRGRDPLLVQMIGWAKQCAGGAMAA